MTVDLQPVVQLYEDFGVRTILIGGWAASLHGSLRSTVDHDFVYDRSDGNVAKLCAAMATINPRLRGAPAGLPFVFDEATVRSGLNFTLQTDLGAIDLLGEVTGGGRYADLMPHTQELMVFGCTLRVVTLERLIQLKRAAGRPKDLEALAELTALLEERRRMEGEAAE